MLDCVYRRLTLEVVFPEPKFGKYFRGVWVFEAAVFRGSRDDISMLTAQEGVGETLNGNVCGDAAETLLAQGLNLLSAGDDVCIAGFHGCGKGKVCQCVFMCAEYLCVFA